VKVYKAECREILRRYRAGEITRAACINALDAAVAVLVPTLAPDQLEQLRHSELYQTWNQRLDKLTRDR
jgi:hypothetical protein